MRKENKKKPKKRVLIQLRTDEDDKNKIVEFAKEEGMTITDFVKFCTLNKAPRIKKAKPDREVFIRILGELGRIGSNVNQIAKAMNTDMKNYYSISIKETLIAETLLVISKASTAILTQLVHDSAKGPSQGERQSACDVSANESEQ
jgi:hypothetical protein